MAKNPVVTAEYIAQIKAQLAKAEAQLKAAESDEKVAKQELTRKIADWATKTNHPRIKAQCETSLKHDLWLKASAIAWCKENGFKA